MRIANDDWMLEFLDEVWGWLLWSSRSICDADSVHQSAFSRDSRPTDCPFWVRASGKGHMTLSFLLSGVVVSFILQTTIFLKCSPNVDNIQRQLDHIEKVQ